MGSGGSLLSRRHQNQGRRETTWPLPIRIGIVGMGAAGWALLPAIRGQRAFQLAAVAEPATEMR